MRLKHICFLNPLTCRKSMEIVCVYCITTDHIFKPDKFDEASLNSTNSELRRTTARVSEQNIVQVWLVRSCEICAILCPWTSLDCSVCLWCLQMASFLIHFIAFGVPMFWIAWQFIYLSRTNLLTILILFWCFTDALPLAGQACGTGKGGRNWDPWSFWLPQGVYPKTAGRAGSKQTREWQSPEFFFWSVSTSFTLRHFDTFRFSDLHNFLCPAWPGTWCGACSFWAAIAERGTFLARSTLCHPKTWQLQRASHPSTQGIWRRIHGLL